MSEDEKSYCKCCGKEIISENPKCCIYQKVFNNFTGEFNYWDEIGDEIIRLWKLEKQLIRGKR